MQFLRKAFILLWRLWFYVLILGTIIPVIPFLLVIISKDSFYPIFYRALQFWGKTILFFMGFKVSVERETELIPENNYIFCPNHTSMVDPMLLLAVIKNNPFVFVGKAELAKIPLFGFFYKRTCILVDRADAQSRSEVFPEVQKRFQAGLSVCLFPEGLVSEDESIILNPLKSGAFILGIEHQIPIVPISFYDCKKRFSYRFFSGGPGVLRVKIHAPIATDAMTIANDKEILKERVYQLLYKDLVQDTKTPK